MTLEQNSRNDFHFIIDGDLTYLFNPLTMELFKLSKEEVYALNNAENNPSTHFYLDYEGTALEFADIDYCPSYEINVLLTTNCNLRCDYCFAAETYRSNEKLDPLVCLDFLRGLMSHFELKFVKFFGGEPLLQFEKLKTISTELIIDCEAAGRPLPSFGLVSNGLLLKQKVISYLRDTNFVVTISCDGINVPGEIKHLRYPNLHLATTVIKNIVNALNQGLQVSVQTTYTTSHVQAGISPVDLLEDFRSIGIQCIHIMPEFNSLSNLTPTQMKWVKEGFRQAAFESVFSVIGEYPIMLVYILKILSRLLDITKGYFICGAGIDSLSMMPSGKVYPCYLLMDQKLEIGNATIDSFETMLPNIYKTRKMFVESRKTQIDVCARCWARTLCASCFGPKYLTEGLLGAPDRAFCAAIHATIEGCLIALAKIKENANQWKQFLTNFENILTSSGQPIILINQ